LVKNHRRKKLTGAGAVPRGDGNPIDGKSPQATASEATKTSKKRTVATSLERGNRLSVTGTHIDGEESAKGGEERNRKKQETGCLSLSAPMAILERFSSGPKGHSGRRSRERHSPTSLSLHEVAKKFSARVHLS